MKTLFLAFLIGALPSAHAANTIPVVCPAADSFKEQIFNCGENKLAVTFASTCATAMLKNADITGKSLAAAMEGMQKNSGQNRSMDDMKKRLTASIGQLEQQITELQVNTAIVANYTSAMIDFPDGKDEDSSAACFNSAYHSLQKIVGDLDSEIVRAKHARLKAISLFNTVASSGADLSTLGADREVSSESTGKTHATPGVKGRAERDSDISGTKPDKK